MLIDSNIIIYSLNTSSPKHLRAKAYLENNSENIIIAHQNILEAMRVLTHKNYPKKVTLKRVLKELLSIVEVSSIISPKETTIFLAIELINKYKLTSDLIFDAYLAATAISNGIKVVATDNEKDFSKIKEIKVVNPFKITSN